MHDRTRNYLTSYLDTTMDDLALAKKIKNRKNLADLGEKSLRTAEWMSLALRKRGLLGG